MTDSSFQRVSSSEEGSFYGQAQPANRTKKESNYTSKEDSLTRKPNNSTCLSKEVISGGLRAMEEHFNSSTVNDFKKRMKKRTS